MKRRTFILTSLATLLISRFAEATKGVFMISHPADTRGNANHGWLKSRHTFSFAEYYNPERMSFGALRVLNDDSVEGGNGFGTHPHRDMEIISIPLQGTLSHKDSEGNHGLIKKGEVQIMSAGTGILHSEENANKGELVKFLQIWVMPKKLGIAPRYGQKEFGFKDNTSTLVVSPDGREGSLEINQDAFFTIVNMDEGKTVDYKIKKSGNGLYIFVLDGALEVNGAQLSVRDGLGIPALEEAKLKVHAKSEVLLMEVPMNQFTN
jgi:redox-sensitive bicupin YhaK (pirin superfamily)